MATTVTCDRCGSKIEPRPDGCEQTKILFMPPATDDLPEYDLCPACDQEFRRWINGRSPEQDPARKRTRGSDLPQRSTPRSP